MWLKEETHKVQTDLAMFCRTGETVTIPGAISERLPHYRRLVFNIVNDSLESAFPITFKYIEPNVWGHMVSSFFTNHKCSTPLIWQMPLEFYSYVKEKEFAKVFNIPYLNDLLWFEWLEVELFMMEDLPVPKSRKKGDWFDDIIVINPEHRLIKLNYPVHKRMEKENLTESGDYFLLMFRHPKTGAVQFITLSVLFALVLEKLINDLKPLKDIVDEVIYLFDISDRKLLEHNVTTFMVDLEHQGFIFGFKAS